MTMPSSRVVVYITAIGWHCRKKQRNRHIPLSLSVTRPSCDSCDYRERGRRNKIDAANEVKCSDFDSTDRKGKPGGVPLLWWSKFINGLTTISTTTSQRSNKSAMMKRNQCENTGNVFDSMERAQVPPSLGPYKYRRSAGYIFLPIQYKIIYIWRERERDREI